MANTVIGLYRDESEVARVEEDLAQSGFPRNEITRHDEAGADLRSWLIDQGVPDSEAEDYVLGVRNGGKLVVLEASDDRAAEAVDIMQRHERAAAGAARGGTPQGKKPQGKNPNPSTGAGTEMGAAGGKGARRDSEAKGRGRASGGAGEETFEVTEEELEVGKQAVERGGVRVRQYVSEKPVEKDVHLRDETVNVDRRPADRPVRGAEADEAFREKSFEMTESHEEPVVRKRARVIEEVVLSKDVAEHTETVRDSVRRTDVDVERTDETFAADRDHFRTHHREKFAKSQYDYDEFEPAYRYGIELANHPDYRGRNWNEVSSKAGEHWERKNPGTWSEFEPAARYGYERVAGRGGGR